LSAADSSSSPRAVITSGSTSSSSSAISSASSSSTASTFGGTIVQNRDITRIEITHVQRVSDVHLRNFHLEKRGDIPREALHLQLVADDLEDATVPDSHRGTLEAHRYSNLDLLSRRDLEEIDVENSRTIGVALNLTNQDRLRSRISYLEIDQRVLHRDLAYQRPELELVRLDGDRLLAVTIYVTRDHPGSPDPAHRAFARLASRFDLQYRLAHLRSSRIARPRPAA